MNNIKKQQGSTFISWIITVAIILSIVLTGFILGPVYLKHHSLRSLMDTLAADQKTVYMSKREVHTAFAKRLDINSLDDEVNPNDLKIERVKGTNNQRQLTLKYETRKHWVGNIDFLIQFDHSVKIR